jgi:hypothetical protein
VAGAWSCAASATRKTGIVPPHRRAIVRVGLGESARADPVEIVPTVGRAIAVVHPEPDPVRRAVSRLTEIAEVLPAEIATGRERAERTLPPERWMDRSDCGSNV